VDGGLWTSGLDTVQAAWFTARREFP